ncbi:hypothetical protein SeLEV6574_g07226 [Synchytrium endobioticum]|uniref:G-protein coupled receptors family 1 profile domain-containing protein n=1 Tax=Synchytrium endobioticum TaxID=286115 RepID=A0A507CID3_9FUNG|nr:hypothetical protein SeLEV6574_g07226 [Synchytrium endobioticum]
MSPRFLRAGWLFGALVSVPLLLDTSVAWGSPPVYAGTQWSSRAPIAVVQSMLAWACIFLGVATNTTCYYLIRRYIKTTRANLEKVSKGSQLLQRIDASTIRYSTQLLPDAQNFAPAAVADIAPAIRQTAKVDVELDMCRKFIMLSLVSAACNIPAMAWILYELFTGRRALEPFVALAIAFIALEPSLDCALIIHINPGIRNRILEWLKWVSRPLYAKDSRLPTPRISERILICV